MRFFASETQAVIGPVRLLRQHGARTGPTGRPPNSYAVLLDGRSILFDAPFSWCLPDLDALAADGCPPEVMILSHAHLVAQGDAFEQLIAARRLPIVLHPADRGPDAAAVLRGAFLGLHDVAMPDGARLMHLPGHTPGSIMLYLPMEGGIVLTGDCAVGPAPGEAGPLRRPRLPREVYPGFAQAWMTFVHTTPVSAVLPLHGAPLLRTAAGDGFDRSLSNVWEGEAMDPSRDAA
jgi:glyoxylase-like metal-dependent hydrolase (beta-lactamase superfamily II)